jgi:hypothetical protein
VASACSSGLAALAAFLPTAPDAATPFPAFAAWTAALVADAATLYRLPRQRAIDAAFAAVSATPVLDLVRRDALTPDAAADAFRYVWLGRSTRSPLGPVRRLVHTDRASYATSTRAPHRTVARDRPPELVPVRNRHPTRASRRERAGASGHLPVRQLFAQTCSPP